MVNLFYQVGYSGLAIVLLALIAIFMAIRGIVLAYLVSKQGFAPHSVLSGIIAKAKAQEQSSNTSERELVITDSWEERIVMNPCITFVFDDTNVKAQCSAVIAVMQDYVPMLELGLVDDVDATLDEMLQKCNDSGLQEVKDEFFRQYEEWYATR